MKMLKKIFGVVTVSVALGATGLKADFKQDLLKVFEQNHEDPHSESGKAFLEDQQALYRRFKSGIISKMMELLNSRCIEGATIDDGGVFCPGKSEIEMLKFSEWLWERIERYREKSKEITDHQMEKQVKNGKSCGFCTDFFSQCRIVFVRRMCNFGFACIRFLAGRFASEEMLFSQKNIDSRDEIIGEITKSLHFGMRNYVERHVLRSNLLHWLKFDCREWHDYERHLEDCLEELRKMCKHCLDYAGCYGLILTKFSDQDFRETNMFLESVKDDNADALWEKCKFKEKIDAFKKQKEHVSSKLADIEGKLAEHQKLLSKFAIDIKYAESGEILSATPKTEKDKYGTDVHKLLYNEYFVGGGVVELRERKSNLESEITKLEAKPHIEDKEDKFIKGIFAFRGYNAWFRLFFYLHTCCRYHLMKQEDQANAFGEEYDSIVKEIFIKSFPVVKDYSTKHRSFSEEKEIPAVMMKGCVCHHGELKTKKDFYDMQKNNNTTLFNMAFIEEEAEEMNKSSLY